LLAIPIPLLSGSPEFYDLDVVSTEKCPAWTRPYECARQAVEEWGSAVPGGQLDRC